MSGGQYGGSYSSVLWKLEKTNSWKDLDVRLQFKSNHICPVMNDFIVFCGGFNDGGWGQHWTSSVLEDLSSKGCMPRFLS